MALKGIDPCKLKIIELTILPGGISVMVELVSISAVRLVIIVMVAYVIVLV